MEVSLENSLYYQKYKIIVREFISHHSMIGKNFLTYKNITNKAVYLIKTSQYTFIAIRIFNKI